MKASRKISLIIEAVLVFVLFSMPSLSPAAVRLGHVVSIYADDKGLGLKQPEGVAYQGEALLIVADTGHGRLLRYTFQDGKLQPGALEIKAPQLPYPVRVELGSKGEIFALDAKQRRIVRFTPEGNFKGYLDPAGSFSPTPYVPRSFKIDGDDRVYVLDVFSRRVLVLNPDGEYEKQIPFPKDYGFFSDLTIDFRGNVLLIDSVYAKVFTASKASASFTALTGSLKEYMRFPTSIATDGRGRIYLLDQNGSRLIVLGQDGSFLGRKLGMGWKEGFINYPSEFCIGERGELFIADTMNNRIQVFAILD